MRRTGTSHAHGIPGSQQISQLSYPAKGIAKEASFTGISQAYFPPLKSLPFFVPAHFARVVSSLMPDGVGRQMHGIHRLQIEMRGVLACSESVGLKRVADYWHAVIQINDYQKHRFVETVIGSMFNTVSGKKIALLGFAFKKVLDPNLKTLRATLLAESATPLRKGVLARRPLFTG